MDAARSIEMTMLCKRHGEQRVAQVCDHLLHGQGLGFTEVSYGFGYEADDELEAWCVSCSRADLDALDDLESEEIVPFLNEVCELCYEEIRARNVNMICPCCH